LGAARALLDVLFFGVRVAWHEDTLPEVVAGEEKVKPIVV
jgi:hypothetical protein